jgi:hypothetical protein
MCPPPPLSNQRMQPTGRGGPELRSDDTLVDNEVETAAE